MFIRRALMAGEPLWNTPENGGGGNATSGDDGAGESPSGGQDHFDKGYGKGIEKGKREGMSAVLSELGVSSLDDAKALAKAAQDARESARKAAEEQGNYKSLYEEQQAKLQQLEQRAAAADRYEALQKSELDALTEKMSDDDKAMLADLPLDRALALAKRLGSADKKPVGAGPAGNGNEPGSTGAKDLAYYEKKGLWNLRPDERAEAERLEAEQFRNVTVESLVEAQQIKGLRDGDQ